MKILFSYDQLTNNNKIYDLVLSSDILKEYFPPFDDDVYLDYFCFEVKDEKKFLLYCISHNVTYKLYDSGNGDGSCKKQS